MLLSYSLFFVLALIAEIIGTISGFGSSILFVPVASLFFDFKLVLAITAIFHVFSNLSKIVLFRHGIDRNCALKLGIPAIVFVITGAWLTRYIPQKQAEWLMSGLLIILATFLIIKRDTTLAQNNRNLIIGGSTSGFLAGLIGTGGAIRGLTLMAFNLEKNVFIATSALIDLGVDSSRAVVYIYNGYFQSAYLIFIPLLILISIAGTWIGKRILHHVSSTVFRYLVLGIIILTSCVQIVKIWIG